MADQETEQLGEDCPVCPRLQRELEAFLTTQEASIKTPLPAGHHDGATPEVIVSAAAAEVVIGRMLQETQNPLYVAHYLMRRCMAGVHVEIIKAPATPEPRNPSGLANVTEDELRNMDPEHFGKA